MLANFVADDGPDGDLARRILLKAGDAAIPDLADVETAAVLRKRWIAGTLTSDRFQAAIDDLAGLTFRRYPASPLLQRSYQLRATITVYVALAESLHCDLVTADSRLARATGPNCRIHVLHRF